MRAWEVLILRVHSQDHLPIFGGKIFGTCMTFDFHTSMQFSSKRKKRKRSLHDVYKHDGKNQLKL